AQDVDPVIWISWVDVYLLVLLEPAVQPVKVKGDQVLDRRGVFDRGRVVPGTVLDYPVPGAQCEVGRIALLRAMRVPIRRLEQVPSHVLRREVVDGLQPRLVQQHRSPAVDDRLAAQLSTDPLG